MRRRGKTDGNQTPIVEALRKVGCSVESLASVGRGCPDLLVGFHGMNVLMEVKDGRLPPSARALTPDQNRWHFAWRGQVVVVKTVREALAAVLGD